MLPVPATAAVAEAYPAVVDPDLSDTGRKAAPAETHIAFFAPDVTDVSTIKRVEAFLEHGLPFTVFSFRRDRYNAGYQPSWPLVDLGMTEDGHYRRRLLALLRAVKIVAGQRRALSRASIFYARNIDQLALALLARAILARRAKVVYEVLDVVPVFTSNGKAGKVFRTLERWLLKSVSMMVVSSPGFMRNFYEPVQRYTGEWFLLENKLMAAPPRPAGPAAGRSAEERRRAGGYRWVVGYFGLIRGDRTFEVMTRMAERFPDILFLLRGIITTVDRKRFDEACARLPNLVYEGPYVNPDDLADLYAQVDLVWALDLENEEHNSRWLMPCRFYEGGLHGVPLMAAKGFEVGNRIEELGIGWTFAAPYEDTVGAFLESLDPAEHAAKRQRLAELPRDTFVAGKDTAELCHLLSQAGALRTGSLTRQEVPAT